MVYNGEVVRWTCELATAPWRDLTSEQPDPRALYASVRDSTKMRLKNHWEHIMKGDLVSPFTYLLSNCTDSARQQFKYFKLIIHIHTLAHRFLRANKILRF